MKIKLHTHFKHWIFIVLSMFLCNLSALAVQLQIGQTTYFSVTAPEGYITSASWSASAPQLQLEPQMEVCTVCFWNYYEGNVTVTCNFTYTYQSYYNGRYHNMIGNGSRSFIVTCVRPSFSLDKTKVTLQPGEKMILSSITSPKASSQYPKVYWQNSNSSVVEIKYDEVYDNSYTQKVTILAKKSGTSTITASIGGGISATCEITVANIDPSSVSLPSTAWTKVGESVKLSPTLYPSNAQTTYTWSSDNTNVATVSQNGLVNGKKTGTANITVKTANGKTATCRVTVEKGDLTLSCNTESGLIAKGTKVTLTANRSDAEIYYTLDGSTPTYNSNRYTGSISVNDALTLKAIAMGSEYNSSNLIVRNFQITSLLCVSQTPVKKSWDRYCIPSIQFNDNVFPGKYINSIKVLSDKGEYVPVDIVVHDNCLYFVSQSKLEKGIYKITVPENAIIDSDNHPNMKISYDFEIDIFVGVKSVCAANFHTFVIKEDNSLWGWGENSCGQLGDGTTEDRLIPVKIMDNVEQVSSTDNHTLALKTDGSVWGWGENKYSKVSSDIPKYDIIKSPIKLMDNIKQVSAGANTSFVIKNDNSLWGWGYNANCQIGDGTRHNSDVPVKVMDNVQKVITSSGNHTLAIKNKTLYGWGVSSHGQLGFVANTVTDSPKRIMDNVADISAGRYESMAIKTNGELWNWGDDKDAPYKVMDKVIQASGWSGHFHAIKNDNSLWAYGSNQHGELGDGTYTRKNDPVQIIENGVTQVADGYNVAFAITTDDTLLGWGWQAGGKLGDGISDDYGYCKIPKPIIAKEYPNVQGFSCEQEAISILIGQKNIILLKLNPTEAICETISFESSNTKIVTVSERGIVTGISKGTATITVTVDDKFTATCKVTVEESTGINEVESQRTADDHIYSLSGQRLAAPKKGINIINGRKVIVK